MYESILSWAEAHPEAFGLLCTLVVVPLFGSLASFADAWLAKRAPVLTALLRALLPDVKRALAIAASGALESRKLPVPPEVRQLTVERVEKAIEETASKRAPVPPPPIVMLSLPLVVALMGCTRAEQIQAANAHRETGHASAHALGADAPEVRSLSALCDYEALEGRPDARERSIDLDNRGCVRALGAQTAFSAAHRAEVHAIEAAQRGECVIGAPRSLPACDLLGMARHTLEAGIALADATAEVVAAVRGAR